MTPPKTMAAYDGRRQATKEDIDTAAELALPHRVRRQLLQDVLVDVKTVRKQRQTGQITL